MVSGSIAGLFSTTVGGVPKPRVDALDVTTNGIRHEIIRDKKHHGGTEKAVCLMSVETMEHLQSLGHPIHGGSTGENILMDVPQASLGVGVLPIAETFGFSNDIRAASQGRAVWNTENLGFEMLPPQLFDKVVGEIRTRKGLKPEPNPESYYAD